MIAIKQSFIIGLILCTLTPSLFESAYAETDELMLPIDPELFPLESDFIDRFQVDPNIIAEHSGWDVGNGGDVVYCKKSPDSKYFGFYSLDYLATTNGNDDNLRLMSTWQESMTQIERLFRYKAPELEYGLSQYFKGLRNTDRYHEPQIWLDARLRTMTSAFPRSAVPAPGLNRFTNSDSSRKVPWQRN